MISGYHARTRWSAGLRLVARSISRVSGVRASTTLTMKVMGAAVAWDSGSRA
jgi:hypothetical protein